MVDLLKLCELGMEHGFYYFFQFVSDLSDYLRPPQRCIADIYLLQQVLIALAHQLESVDAIISLGMFLVINDLVCTDNNIVQCYG